MSREASKLISMPIMDISEGRQIGRVKDAIFDPEAHALYGLLVTADVGGESFLNRQAIRGLGESAVTVDGETAMHPIAGETRARQLMESGIRLRGCKVVTETGDSLGTLDKIVLDDEGCVEHYESQTGILGFGDRYELRPEQVVKIGADAIVVTADSKAEADEQREQRKNGGATSTSRVEPAGESRATNGSAVPPPSEASVVQGVPVGTDPSKETVVSVTDSQPGNLIDDER